MKLSTSSQTLIQQAIRNAVGKTGSDVMQSVITDIHLQPNPISGELNLLDDEDTVLQQVVIEEWVDYAGKNFYKDVESSLHFILSQMKEKKEFETISVLSPFSFVLLDEEKETITDLLLVDDDTILVQEELLQGLNEELDTFLKNLLNS